MRYTTKSNLTNASKEVAKNNGERQIYQFHLFPKIVFIKGNLGTGFPGDLGYIPITPKSFCIKFFWLQYEGYLMFLRKKYNHE